MLRDHFLTISCQCGGGLQSSGFSEISHHGTQVEFVRITINQLSEAGVAQSLPRSMWRYGEFSTSNSVVYTTSISWNSQG